MESQHTAGDADIMGMEEACDTPATAGANEGGVPPTSANTLEAALAAVQAREAAIQEQLLRLAADFDNFRKRTRKEQEDLTRFAIEPVVRDLLEVVDNLERALMHGGTRTDDPIAQGVGMVLKQFSDVLGRYGVVSFSAAGKAFDPNRHEAVGQMPAPDAASAGMIMAEVSKGYTIHDRLLRPARVVVAAAPVQAPVDTLPPRDHVN